MTLTHRDYFSSCKWSLEVAVWGKSTESTVIGVLGFEHDLGP